MWSASGLPSWLAFGAASPTLNGTAVSGSFPFTISVTDANGVGASTLYTLLVNPAPVILPAALPAATQYLPYSQAFSVTPGTGTPPFIWSAVTLPAFLTFNPATQILSGTPTVSGPFPVTIKVTDANGVTASPTYSLLVIAAGPVIGTSSLPNGQYNSPLHAIDPVGNLWNRALYMVAWIWWCFARGHDSKSVGQHLGNTCPGGHLVCTDHGDGFEFIDRKHNSVSHSRFGNGLCR